MSGLYRGYNLPVALGRRGWPVNVRCAIRNDNNLNNDNNGFRVCASHAFLDGSARLILRYYFRQKCSPPTDGSRGKTGEIARSCPGWAFSVFINGRWRRVAPCGAGRSGKYKKAPLVGVAFRESPSGAPFLMANLREASPWDQLPITILPSSMDTSDFDYDLPESSIAQTPLESRPKRV